MFVNLLQLTILSLLGGGILMFFFVKPIQNNNLSFELFFGLYFASRTIIFLYRIHNNDHLLEKALLKYIAFHTPGRQLAVAGGLDVFIYEVITNYYFKTGV